MENLSRGTPRDHAYHSTLTVRGCLPDSDEAGVERHVTDFCRSLRAVRVFYSERSVQNDHSLEYPQLKLSWCSLAAAQARSGTFHQTNLRVLFHL